MAVKANTANLSGIGGGIFGDGGTLNLIDSTVSGNSAGNGGGVWQQGNGTANITNSTISGNRATQATGAASGGVLAGGGALMNILNSTIASNTSGRPGGGIMTSLGTAVFVKNTIVSGNTVNNCDNAQLGGALLSQGNNISSDDSCPFTKATDKQNTNPRLGLLANNGGPTDTRALLLGSPAVDVGANTACPPRDQRGIARRDGDGNGTVICDIGAFEAATNTKPTITNVRPIPGSKTRDRKPLIGATVRDAQTNLAKSNIQLFVDGRRKTTFSYNTSTDRLNFTSGQLSFGGHRVRIVANDGLLSTTKSWSFAVVS